MKEMCIKALNDFGSRLDQLIYSTGEVIHNAVCDNPGKLHTASYTSLHTYYRTTTAATINCILTNISQQ